jgi:2-succinyl-6-hydroxy-2,4-cyclohexadiene-1-carboxylate synthase
MSIGAAQEIFVETAGVRLRAIVEGIPRPGTESVLILHGFTGAAGSMSCVSEPMACARRVARLELVGHGESDAPSEVAAYSMAACADQIAAASQALGLGRPHLLGYSMGGRAALAAALAHPKSFSSLVLVGATPGIADPALRKARIASDEALANRIERDGVEDFVDRWMALPIFASQSRLGAAVLARARAERLRNSACGLAQSLRGMGAGAQAPQHGRLDRFTRPVLLAVGEEDAKFREIASSLEGAMKDARTEIVEGVGHAAHLEAPDSFVRIVEQFLDEIEPNLLSQASAAKVLAAEFDARPDAGRGDSE